MIVVSIFVPLSGLVTEMTQFPEYFAEKRRMTARPA